MARAHMLAVAAAAVLLLAATAQAGEPRVDPEDVGNWPFARFVASFRRPLTPGTGEYSMREALYQVR